MNKKVRNIIILSVLAILGIVYAVFYILFPDATKQVTGDVLDYVCTKPLPVIGISLLALGILVFKVISVSGIGNKSLKECRKDLEESKVAQEKTHAELLAFEESFDKKLDEFKEKSDDQLRQICENIPNKNVKELGEKFYGTKEENSSSAQ